MSQGRLVRLSPCANDRGWPMTARLVGPFLGFVAAAVPVSLLWGFTIDDALVSARVASNIARGLGHRFNADGPIVDAVTPLGWAYLLAPFARSGPLSALCAAQVAGTLAWLLAAAWLGHAIFESGRRARRLAPLAALAFPLPLAAWAVAGLETGLVVALATAALSRSPFAPLAAGAAAAWRPELIPWALVLSLGTAITQGRAPAGVALAGLQALLPPIAAGAIRIAVFGQAWPLAVLAKPSDAGHGLIYAARALIWSGAPALVIAPRIWLRLDPRARVLLLAAAIHVLAVILAGGDWMPFFRLMAPILPSLLLAGAFIAELASIWATLVRCFAALLPSLVLLATPGSALRTARDVGGHRSTLIQQARLALAGAKRVAALDVGWVGASTEAHVVDLAGITDPSIAVLAGGHTSKRLPAGFLATRDVDALVLLLAPGERPKIPWYESRFDARLAVQRTCAAQAAEANFAPKAVLRLGGTEQSYLILRINSVP